MFLQLWRTSHQFVVHRDLGVKPGLVQKSDLMLQ